MLACACKCCSDWLSLYINTNAVLHSNYVRVSLNYFCQHLQLHEEGYRPLNPRNVRIPPPQPPTDRLLKAVEEFYQEETEDAPRNRLCVNLHFSSSMHGSPTTPPHTHTLTLSLTHTVRVGRLELFLVSTSPREELRRTCPAGSGADLHLGGEGTVLVFTHLFLNHGVTCTYCTYP